MKKAVTIIFCLLLCLIGNFLFPTFASAHGSSITSVHPVGKATSTITTSSHITPNMLNRAAGGPSLAGQWPDQSGCWDSNAFVISSVRVNGGNGGHPILVAMWASPDCGTNWADLQILDGAQLQIQASVFKVTNRDGGSTLEYSSVFIGSRAWSPMVYSPNDKAYACGAPTSNAHICTNPA